MTPVSEALAAFWHLCQLVFGSGAVLFALWLAVMGRDALREWACAMGVWCSRRVLPEPAERSDEAAGCDHTAHTAPGEAGRSYAHSPDPEKSRRGLRPGSGEGAGRMFGLAPRVPRQRGRHERHPDEFLGRSGPDVRIPARTGSVEAAILGE